MRASVSRAASNRASKLVNADVVKVTRSRARRRFAARVRGRRSVPRFRANLLLPPRSGRSQRRRLGRRADRARRRGCSGGTRPTKSAGQLQGDLGSVVRRLTDDDVRRMESQRRRGPEAIKTFGEIARAPVGHQANCRRLRIRWIDGYLELFGSRPSERRNRASCATLPVSRQARSAVASSCAKLVLATKHASSAA